MMDQDLTSDESFLALQACRSQVPRQPARYAGYALCAAADIDRPARIPVEPALAAFCRFAPLLAGPWASSLCRLGRTRHPRLSRDTRDPRLAAFPLLVVHPSSRRRRARPPR